MTLPAPAEDERMMGFLGGVGIALLVGLFWLVLAVTVGALVRRFERWWDRGDFVPDWRASEHDPD